VSDPQFEKICEDRIIITTVQRRKFFTGVRPPYFCDECKSDIVTASMTTDELEQLLEAGAETPSLDFKGSHAWDEREYAKDFMAMANVDGGGRIIVGVDEQSSKYVRTGITAGHKASYSYDVMKDQIAKYCDPFVEFSVEYVRDKQGIEFVVITVQPFKEVPVISKKKTNGLEDATIYYRSASKRPQSTPVANYQELRELLERAAINIMRRYDKLGLKAAGSVRDALKKERGNL
jgi:Putative DNA-binding domain